MIISNDSPLQCAVKEEGGHAKEEIDFEALYEGLEIVKQLALDHLNAVLQKAQKAAAEAKRDQKCPRQYDDKSKRTLKWHKKCREDLAKQGYLSVFDFIIHVKKKKKRQTHLEQLMARTSKSEEESESSGPEELDTKALVSECMDQVHRRELLMH